MESTNITNKNKKITKNQIIIFAIIAVVIIFALVSFNKKQNAAKSIPNNNNKQSSVTGDPNKVEVKNQLISTFPSFPVYPGAKIISSAKVGQSPTRGFEAVWETDASVPLTMSWYLTELKKGGWNVVAPPGDAKTVGEQIAQVSKDKLSVTLDIDQKNSDTTEIIVNIPE